MGREEEEKGKEEEEKESKLSRGSETTAALSPLFCKMALVPNGD